MCTRWGTAPVRRPCVYLNRFSPAPQSVSAQTSIRCRRWTFSAQKKASGNPHVCRSLLSEHLVNFFGRIHLRLPIVEMHVLPVSEPYHCKVVKRLGCWKSCTRPHRVEMYLDFWWRLHVERFHMRHNRPEVRITGTMELRPNCPPELDRLTGGGSERNWICLTQYIEHILHILLI